MKKSVELLLLQEKKGYRALPKELEIRNSDISGQGVFAKVDIPANTFLGITHLIAEDTLFRTPLGGFYNHSDDPNSYRHRINLGSSHGITTIRDIKCGEEIVCKYAKEYWKE